MVNWLGNEGYVLPAILGLVAVVAYIFAGVAPALHHLTRG
ncbi:hypothetical protein AB5I41_19935 [Sphingomonas sp. MMS24-JH45]